MIKYFEWFLFNTGMTIGKNSVAVFPNYLISATAET